MDSEKEKEKGLMPDIARVGVQRFYSLARTHIVSSRLELLARIIRHQAKCRGHPYGLDH